MTCHPVDTLWFRQVGKPLEPFGPPVVLIHGAGASSALWLGASRALASSFTCVIPDLPGHGHSPPPACDSIDAYADALRDALDARGVTRCALVGHSMGGAIALYCALRWPEWVFALVIVGCGARLPVSPATLRLLEGPLAHWRRQFETVAFAHSVSAENRTQLSEEVLRGGVGALRADFLACSRFDVSAQVGQLRVPLQIVFGAEDRIVPSLYGDHLRRAVPGAMLRLIEGAGHMLPIEQPIELARAITWFLEDLY